MNSLGIKEFARDFPLVVSDDLLDFELDGDEIGGDTKKFNLSKGSSSDNFSGGGDDGGGSVKAADQEEELEWLRYFPEVEDNILFDKPGDIGFLGEQHSPVSVLENNSVTNNQTSFGTTSTTSTIALKVPTGFPDYVRKKRVGRKRRSDGFGFGQQHKHLFLEGVNPIRSLKIVKKNRAAATVGGRRCLHCGSDKTPQWRTGPLGKKTLCNACGVRYKSGRLVPEYRPANSPTFTPVLHSNSHRKIMEMRKKKQEGIVPKFVMNGTF